MSMNIYITQDNEKKLREFVAYHEQKGGDATMSGLINTLLREWFEKQAGVTK